MTPQGIFETVSRHLFAQGQRATLAREAGDDENDTFCAYRGENGTKCAVGCLIPDADYSPAMEGRSALSMIHHAERLNYSVPTYFAPNDRLLNDLQVIHDNPHNWDSARDMREALFELAGEHALNADFLSDLKFADGR